MKRPSLFVVQDFYVPMFIDAPLPERFEFIAAKVYNRSSVHYFRVVQ